jgi:hypothetical protein
MTSECEIRLPATLDDEHDGTLCFAGDDANGMVHSDSYYKSAFNCPEQAREVRARAEASGERPWGLCGFNPPKHLRVPGYAYDKAEDSSSGVFFGQRAGVVIPRTIDEGEVLFTPEAGDDAEDAGAGAFAHAFDAEARRRTTTTPGGMSSRPSWGENAYSASQQVRA